MNTATILITGATGDTGGYAIEQLLQKGHQVRALVHRLDDRSKRLTDKGAEVVAGDYLDLDAMRAAANRLDHVVGAGEHAGLVVGRHLAAVLQEE